MTGGRVFSLLVGLWASSAFGQSLTFRASSTIGLDGGMGLARAYFATIGSTEYALVNAGQAIQVFGTNGSEFPPLEQPGTFMAFAVANNVVNGPSSTTTLVAAFDVAPTGCPTARCVDIFFWDASGFVLKGMAPTNVLTATAMAIDATVSPIVIYYASSAPSGLYAQQVTVNPANGAVSLGGVPAPLPVGFSVEGLAVNPAVALNVSDSNSFLYAFTLNLTDGGIVGQPGAYSQLEGISLYSDAGSSVLLGGGSVAERVYALSPGDAGVLVSYTILGVDGGPRVPAAASLDSTAGFMLVTEEVALAPGILNIVPTLAILTDGGTADGGTADAGIPVIPIVAPGPGALPGTTNSCNCSTAGSAPVLFVFLLPLLVSRRRR